MERIIYVEVTNTLQAHRLTGIQRVTKELIKELDQAHSSLKLITYSHRYKTFRFLTKKEKAQLLSNHTNRNYNIPGSYTLRLIYLRLIDWLKSKRLLAITLSSDSVFLDLEAAWYNPIKRSNLLPHFEKNHIISVNLHYDIIPINQPEYVRPESIEKFKEFILAHGRYTKYFICISQYSLNCLKNYMKDRYPNSQVKYFHIPLGSFEFLQNEKINNSLKRHKKYLLCVGTIDKRKNQEIVIDCLDSILESHPDLQLVIAGTNGWGSERIIDRIQNHKYLGINLFWYEGLNDAELSYLYSNAFLTIVPSNVEGYGLSVIESLSFGSIVLSSTGGALPEVGGDLVEYFDPNKMDELYFLILKHLEDNNHHIHQKKKIKTFKPTTWKESASHLLSIIENQILN